MRFAVRENVFFFFSTATEQEVNSHLPHHLNLTELSPAAPHPRLALKFHRSTALHQTNNDANLTWPDLTSVCLSRTWGSRAVRRGTGRVFASLWWSSWWSCPSSSSPSSCSPPVRPPSSLQLTPAHSKSQTGWDR